jgi:hypothetical protein
LPRQSIPNLGLFSVTCLLFTSASVSIGERPEFSANASGVESKAWANARMAYCSMVGICKAVTYSVSRLLHDANSTDLVRCLGNGDRSTDLGGASSVDDSVVSNQVSNDTDSIVQCSLCFINDLPKTVSPFQSAPLKSLPSYCFLGRTPSRPSSWRTPQ